MIPGELSAGDYRSLPQVAARVREFCGLEPGGHSHCVYVAAMGAGDAPHPHWGWVTFRPPGSLADLLAGTDDVARSLWDTGSLLVHIDLDYINTDSCAEAFLHPADVFLKLDPLYRGLWAVLDEFGMPMLDLMTGAGYSFVGKVDLHGAVAERLAALAVEPPAWHRTHARRRPAWAEVAIGADEARAHHGLGLVLEHLAHAVLGRAAPVGAIPRVLDNSEAGAGPRGRECVSIDLTHMGDPLDVRHVRAAFALYQRHRLRPDLFGARAARLPPLAVMPRRRRPLLDLLERGRGLAAAADDAARTDARVPDVAAGLANAIDAYASSALARWHRDYAAPGFPTPAVVVEIDRRLAPAGLPPCVAACLEWPNDLLLKPAHLQLLTRTLLARGWHAHDIATLVVSRYTADGLWGDHWRRSDPVTRAFFDVRVFAGLVATGHDRGIDFNCVSTQEKGMCPGGDCPFDLRRERDRMSSELRA